MLFSRFSLICKWIVMENISTFSLISRNWVKSTILIHRSLVKLQETEIFSQNTKFMRLYPFEYPHAGTDENEIFVLDLDIWKILTRKYESCEMEATKENKICVSMSDFYEPNLSRHFTHISKLYLRVTYNAKTLFDFS